MPDLFNSFTGALLFAAIIGNAILHYFHVKSYDGIPKRIIDYTLMLPIIDKEKSKYKLFANCLVAYVWIISVSAVFQKRVLIMELWDMWDRIP